MKLRLLSFYIFAFGLILNINATNPINDTLKLKETELLNNEIIPSSFPLESFNKKFPLGKKFNIPSSPEFIYENIKEEYGPRNEELITFVKSSLAQIDKEEKWVDKITDETIETLPIGIKQDINGVEYSIGFIKAKITPQFTEFSVFARIRLPQTDEKGAPIELFLGADNVKLSHDGGIFGDANLVLLGDAVIPFNGGNWILTLKGGFDYKDTSANIDKKTFMTINCDGLQDLQLIGDVQFSRGLVLPVNDEGKLAKETRKAKDINGKDIQIPNRVRGDFNVKAKDWNDLIVNISLTPFVLTKHKDKFIFSANEAVFDFSDLRTENVNFPKYYTDNNLLLPSPESWRGVYVKSLQVILPKEFKTTDGISKNKLVSFKAMDMIIDSYGVSGKFEADNLITINEGRTSEKKAWAYSVNHLGLEIAANTFVGASFGGEIILPISDITDEAENSAKKIEEDRAKAIAEGKEIKEDDENMNFTEINVKKNVNGLTYRGIISEEEYSMVVSLKDHNTLEFNLWKAKATLLPNSSVELKVKNHKFYPKAILNGSMGVEVAYRKSAADMKNDRDQAAEIKKAQELAKETNKAEDIERAEKLAYDRDNKKPLASFKGIEFQNLVIQTESPTLDAEYFGYQGKVALANFPVSISKIGIHNKEGKVGLEFTIMVNLMGSDDKGFSADATIGLYGKTVEKNGREKWKFDKLDISEVFIDAGVGPIKVQGTLDFMNDNPVYGNGFIGELSATFGDIGEIKTKAIFGKKDFRYWYFDAAIAGLKIQIGPFQVTGFAGGAFYKMTRKPDVGADFSPSGLSYIPKEDVGLGVKAMVHAAIGDEDLVSVGAGFEIEFNKRGGVNRFGFFGEAQVMSAFDFSNPVEQMKGKLSQMVSKVPLGGTLTKATSTLMDKATEEYTADLVGKGTVTAKIAIEFDFVNESLHASLDVHVKVGDVLTGRLDGGFAGRGVAHMDKEKWFIHMGTPTDPMGLLFKLGPLKIESGGYFMAGDDLPGSPPPPINVTDILGDDLDGLNYMRDENALVSGKGIAFGQDFSIDTGDIKFLMFYARFQAGGGFDIMLKDYGDAQCANRGDDNIGFNGWYANGQGYAYLQGELGIKIKIFFKRKRISIMKGGAAVLLQVKAPNPMWMRGFVGGRYSLLGGAVKGSFRFKLELGEECEFLDESPLGGMKLITDITPKEGATKIDVFAAPQATFSLKINEPIVIPEDDGDKTYKVILERFAMIDENGKEIEGELEWNYMKDRATFISTDILPPNTKMKVQVEVSFQEKIEGVYRTILDEGKKAVEFEERSFTTGTAPNEIPLHNIKYSYPVVDQKQFYKDEYKTGYVQLKRGQDYLFDDTQWVSKVKVIDANGKENLMKMNYSLGDNKVSYTLPKIKNEDEYLINIISKPKNINGSVADPGTKTEVTNLDDDNTFEVTTNKAASVSIDGEIDRLSYSFKTSKHNTFAKKIKSIKVTNDLWGKIVSDVIYLSSNTNEYEGFDVVELKGNTYSANKPLVSAEATLQDDYFQKDINPIIYQKYSPQNRYTVSRDINELGFRPVKALPLISSYVTNVEENVNLNIIATRFPFRYNLPYAYKVDYVDIRDKVLNAYVDGFIASGNSALDILDDDYLFIRKDKYAIKLTYNLPGGIKGTSVEYNYKNPIEIR